MIEEKLLKVLKVKNYNSGSSYCTTNRLFITLSVPEKICIQQRL